MTGRLDWPRYGRVLDRPDEVAELRANYAALVPMCDHYLGRLLDYIDAHDLWRDTALILTTDHGFLLGEHDWWGKNRMPFYDEIAHIPLFDPAPGPCVRGRRRREALTQTIDLMPTSSSCSACRCRPRSAVVPCCRCSPATPGSARAAIYGIFGGATNVTDGRSPTFAIPGPVRAGVFRVYADAGAHAGLFRAEGVRGGKARRPLRLHQGPADAAAAGEERREAAANPGPPLPSRTR